MNRRMFVAAGATVVATVPITAFQADPAIEAVECLRAAEKRLNALWGSAEGLAISGMPTPSVTVYGKTHTCRDELDAQAVQSAYMVPPTLRPDIIATYSRKRWELVQAIRARKELERNLFDPAETEYDKAYERAIATRPTTPAGAAALLSIINTDEPFISNIIAALEEMSHG